MKNFNIRKVKLDASSFKDRYEFQENRRLIRQRHVDRIYNALMDGGHFDFPVSVLEKDGKLLVVDGNHRLEAVKKYLAEKPDKMIELYEMVYKLDETEAKNLFLKLNKTASVSFNDKLQQLKGKNKCVDKLLEKYKNSSIYISSSKPLQLGLMLTSVMRVKYGSLSNDDLIELLDAYPDEIFDETDAFIDFYQECFGEIDHDSAFKFSVPVSISAKLFMCNKDYKDLLLEWLPQAMNIASIRSTLKHGSRSVVKENLAKIKSFLQRKTGKKFSLIFDSSTEKHLSTWTETEKDILRKEYKSTVDVAHIAKLLNRSFTSVIWEAKRLGLTGSPFIREKIKHKGDLK